jgi:imidazolonepropionase-like amidohydrolase
MLTINADSWFDGDAIHHRPVTVVVDGATITAVHEGRVAVPGAECLHVGFLSPGLVESHAHLVLDGHEQDTAKRQAYMEAGHNAFLATGRKNLERLRAAGVTLVRDCGDKWGVNHALRAESIGTTPAGGALGRRGDTAQGPLWPFFAEDASMRRPPPPPAAPAPTATTSRSS